jgi:hypothetical protein
MHQMRTRQQSQNGNSRIFAHMSREVMRLRAEWNAKLEIAQIDDEQAQLGAMRDSQQRAWAPTGQVTPVVIQIKGAKKTVGRKPFRNRQFEALAHQLWQEEHEPGKTLRIEGLRRIAQRLDDSGFGKPSDHLETRAAKALNEHNRHYGCEASVTLGRRLALMPVWASAFVWGVHRL